MVKVGSLVRIDTDSLCLNDTMGEVIKVINATKEIYRNMCPDGYNYVILLQGGICLGFTRNEFVVLQEAP